MKKFCGFLALLVVACVICLTFAKSSFIPFFDYKIYNFLKKEPITTDQSSSVVVIEIDEKSLVVFGQWPWSRIVLAKLAQEVLLAKPAAFGIDIIFAEKDRTSLKEIDKFYKNIVGYEIDTSSVPSLLQDSDQIFASSLEAGNSVLALFAGQRNILYNCNNITTIDTNQTFPYLSKTSNIACSYPTINALASANGFINASSKDGFLRSTNSFINYKNEIIPSLTMAMLLKVDPNLSLKNDPKNRGLAVNFLGKEIKLNEKSEALNKVYSPDKFKKFSASDVLLGNVDLSELSGKFVLLGATAMGLYDRFTDFNGNINPEVYYHASFLENFLNNNLISQPAYYQKANLTLAFIALALIVFVLVKAGYLYGLLLTLIFIILAFIFGYSFLDKKVYLSIGYFITPLIVVFLNLSLIFSAINYFKNRKFLKEINEAHGATIDSMISVIEGKDLETGGHIVRTREYARALAFHLYREGLFKDIVDLKYIETLAQAVPLHDIGKVGVPDNVLRKKGSLTEEEWKIMKQHVEYGKEIIEKATKVSHNKNIFLDIALNIVYTHHERWDGSGYPRGLRGEEIPLEGRIMTLVDVYDALSSKRVYKEAYSFEKTEQYIIENSGKHFDPALVLAFIKIKDEFRKINLENKD